MDFFGFLQSKRNVSCPEESDFSFLVKPLVLQFLTKKCSYAVHLIFETAYPVLLQAEW